MNIFENAPPSLDLEKIVTYAEKNYRIYAKKQPLENLSQLEQLIGRTALNNLPLEKALTAFANAYGYLNGTALNSLLSIGLMYNAGHFITHVTQHTLFELPIEHIDALIDTAYALIEQHDTEYASLLSHQLTGVAPYNLRVKSLALKLCIYHRDMENIDRLFSTISDQDYLLEPSLATLKIEHLFENHTLPEAKTFIESFTHLVHLPSTLLEKMTQFYIRCDDLESGRRLTKYWLRNDVCYHTQFRTLARLIEKEEHASQMIQQIKSINGWYRNPDLIACVEAIQLHPCFDHPPQNAKHSRDAIVANSTTPAQNNELAIKENIILFCFNGAYTVPALVAILGVIRELPPDSPRPVIALFLPECEIPFWENIARQLSRSEKQTTLLLIHENMPHMQKNREHYMSLCDRKLSTMAYGRLFAIRFLLTQGYKKLLYVDSDTVILNDVTPAFSIHQQGYPISAAIEPAIGIIGRAVKTHNIANKKYFNSGVMLIDMQHVATQSIIDNAIAFVLNPDIELLFHDQCAINRAVQGYFHPLPDIYNYLFFPGAALHNPGSIILHFLDTPKPWEAAHRGGSGVSLWRDQWLRAKADLVKLGIAHFE